MHLCVLILVTLQESFEVGVGDGGVGLKNYAKLYVQEYKVRKNLREGKGSQEMRVL